MFIYNVTVKVQNDIANDWITWAKEEHLPEVVATGCFEHARMYHLLEHDDEEGKTYTIQYEAVGRAPYHRYIEIYADKLRKKSFEKWGNKFIAYRSVMEEVV